MSTKRFTMKPDGFLMENTAGEAVFDTSRKTLNLVPQAVLTGTASLAFPNFIAGAAGYLYSGGSRNGNGEAPYAESCATYGPITTQDWGPGYSNNINRVLLGAVPAGTDFIDVSARFAQTSAPDTVMGNPIVKAVAENQWMSLGDGCALLEDKGRIKRLVHVELIGTSVYASLYQSAVAQYVKLIEVKTNLDVFYDAEDPPFPETPHFSYGSDDPNPCSRSFAIALASSWSMQFKILPGRYA